MRILKNTVIENQRNWNNALYNALWADTVTPKEALGNSPYFLIYRQEAILPTGLYLPYLQLSQASRGQLSSIMQQRIDTLLMLKEEKGNAKRKFTAHQQLIKKWFDKHKEKDKSFEVGDLVLKWDNMNEPKGNHSKLQNIWLSPFQVAEKIGVGTYHLQNLRGELDAFPINGQDLNFFFP